MSSIDDTLAGMEFAQVGWVVPDIEAAVQFLSKLGINGFPPAAHVRAQDLNMSYHGNIEDAEWLTTQTYSGRFIELVQPLSGKSIFHDYLAKYPLGGVQHMAFRTQVSEFDRVIGELCEQGFTLISEVNHPIARMAFFDTYRTLGVATEIMGITEDGWKAVAKMEGK